jgi:hypothetical protein
LHRADAALRTRRQAWADVLAKQRNAKDALAKYDEALKCAPNWKHLKEGREVLAKQKG